MYNNISILVIINVLKRSDETAYRGQAGMRSWRFAVFGCTF